MSTAPHVSETTRLLGNLDVIRFYSALVPSFKPTGAKDVKCICPFHGGDGLSINSQDGLWKCHSENCKRRGSAYGFLECLGYDPAKIRSTLMEYQYGGAVRSSASPPMPATKTRKPDLGPIVATYDYTDEAGALLFQVTRHDPKTFRQRRPDGNGGWLWNLRDTRRVLYRLREVLDAVQAGWLIYVVEGERDADAINDLDSGGDFFATCNSGGAGKWSADYNAALAGAAVVIIADDDEPGRKHALDVRHHLRGVAKSVAIVLPKTGKDASDHLEAGHTLADFVAMREPGEIVSRWTPSTLEGVTDPNVGRVEYLVDRLIPKGEIVGIAATFKSGKTLAAYSLLLSSLRGVPVFGSFAVVRPLCVVVFQEEMPAREDNRRLRRLALGLGLDPAEILAYVASGQLVFYNRVGLDLSDAEGIASFLEAVRAANADLVLLDSLIAAAGAVDLNDNGAVRRMFSAAFLPLTTEERSLAFLHHKRKGLAGPRSKDADRDSFLGAQAIAAASGRMYSLERLDEPEDAPKDPTRFRSSLNLFGSWTPEEAVSTVLETRDDGDGTTVTALDDAEQVRAGGVNAKQRAALALTKIVGIRRTVNRKALVEEVASDLGVTTRTVRNGLAYAKSHGWIDTEEAGTINNEMNVIPGERLGDAC